MILVCPYFLNHNLMGRLSAIFDILPYNMRGIKAKSLSSGKILRVVICEFSDSCIIRKLLLHGIIYIRFFEHVTLLMIFK